ncbi:hypothetical protein AAH446_16025 [Erwinia sp. P6884]|uniref:hypothetical protein n=1 Tax=Erwinia sp. P6884 TaxID=3141450 RepID=UPI00318B4053
MGFPSSATDYVETRLDLNELFIRHPSATSMFEDGDTRYFVDASVQPGQGQEMCFELFGEQQLGKIMGGCIVTPDGEVIEGDLMNEVIILGKVVLKTIQVFDGRPTI